MAKITALEGLNFIWDEEKVNEVKEAWKEGLHIAEIARMVKRSQAEVFVLLMDLELKNQIPKRKLGIFGV